MKKSIVPAALLAATLGLAGCSQVPAGQQALEVSSWGAPTLGECVPEESNPGTITVDLIRFPARTITFDANDEPDAERAPYKALSKPKSPPLAPGVAPSSDYSTGQAEMAIPVTLTFDMTTDCEQVKKFYKDFATRDSGWLDGDGKVTPGWLKLLNYTVSQPAEQAVISITQKYPWQKIWNDEAVRIEYKNALQAQLPKDVAARTGGQEFFSNFLVTVGKPFPTDDRLRQSISDQQSSQAAADAKRIELTAQADAEKAAANSQKDAAIAQRDAEVEKAKIKAAEIGAYPTVEDYLKDHGIDKGVTPWPSPIIAGAR